MWKSEHIAALTQGELWGETAVALQGWSLDSRKIIPGLAFIALKGEHTDGHRYIKQAWEAGASVVLAELSGLQEFGLVNSDVPAGRAIVGVRNCVEALQKLAAAWCEELNAQVVGITGSNGKTTTKDMVAAVLSAEYSTHKNQENYNNELGLPLTILNAPPATEIMVLEMGMRGLGQIKALCDICKPSLGIITNIGTTHLELLGTKENIARAKWELIDSLPREGIAILNAEDYYSVQKAAHSEVQKVFYGIKGQYGQPDIRGINVRAGSGLNTSFEIGAGEKKALVNLPLPGEHNVLNALAALAAGLKLGVSLDKGARALQELKLSKMRLEIVEAINHSIVINDVYNANPVSMQASLKVLAERGGEKTIAILGEMYELGESTVEGHREVGRTAASLGIKELITVGSLAQEIARGARDNGFPPSKLHCCDSCEQAASQAQTLIEKFGPGTWLLIKGSRGMKMERVSQQLAAKKGINEK